MSTLSCGDCHGAVNPLNQYCDGCQAWLEGDVYDPVGEDWEAPCHTEGRHVCQEYFEAWLREDHEAMWLYARACGVDDAEDPRD